MGEAHAPHRLEASASRTYIVQNNLSSAFAPTTPNLCRVNQSLARRLRCDHAGCRDSAGAVPSRNRDHSQEDLRRGKRRPTSGFWRRLMIPKQSFSETACDQESVFSKYEPSDGLSEMDEVELMQPLKSNIRNSLLEASAC